MSRFALILVFIIASITGYSQKPILVKGSVFDAETGQPIAGVHVAIKGTTLGTTTNTAGTYSINLVKFNDTLVYSHVSYKVEEKSYQAANLKADILLEPTMNMLPPAIVKPVINISKGMLLDVTDYYFLGDSILYSGFCYRYNKKNNPWIVLLAPNGDTIFTYCVGMEGEFYKDCLGNLHYLTQETAYQIIFENNSMHLDFPTKINEFREIMDNCKFESNNKLLFSQYSNNDQILMYYHADVNTYETEVFRTIADEVKLNMLAFQGLFFSMGPAPSEADLRFEELIMYTPVFAPILLARDTITIINYTDSEIEWYDTCYNALGTTPIYFQNSKYCEDQIIVDDITGKVYAIYLKNGKTSVREIFIHSGSVGDEIAIPDFYWISNIKAHNNKLFFLYQQKYSGELRALYRMFLE